MRALIAHLGSGLLVLGAILVMAPQVSARSVRYRVAGERRLSEVARKVYGRGSAAAILAAANHLAIGAPLKSGDSLRVPICLKIPNKREQSLSRLARLHLRRKSRSTVLAAVNRLDPDKLVAVGVTLTIPALLWHQVRRGDSMISLSRAYYRNRDGRWLLRKVNGNRPSNKLEPGEKILIPIFAEFALEQKVQRRIDRLPPVSETTTSANDSEALTVASVGTGAEVRVPPSTQGSPASKGPPTQSPAVNMTRAYLQALDSPVVEHGIAFYRRGDFLACVAYFRRSLLDPSLVPGRRVAAQVWLASCYVGADETERAEEAMLGALRSAPRLKLDPTSTSPKVLQVLERARGRVVSN